MRLRILSIGKKEDGSMRLSAREESAPSMSVPWTAYCPSEPWNAGWKAGDVVEVDAREKTSANGNKYLTLYPTAALANAEPREIPDGDAIRALHLFIDARLNTIERKINNLLGIEDGQPNFSPND